MRTDFLVLVYPCFERLWKFSLRAEWELLDHVTQAPRLCSRRGVTIKGNQRAVRLTTVSMVEDGFILGQEFSIYGRGFRKFNVSEKCYFILLWYLNLVHKAGRFKSTYLKLCGSSMKGVSKIFPSKYQLICPFYDIISLRPYVIITSYTFRPYIGHHQGEIYLQWTRLTFVSSWNTCIHGKYTLKIHVK